MMTPKELDEQTLQSLLAKDLLANFHLLTEKYTADLYGYIYRELKDKSDAEDVLQSVLFKAYLFLRDSSTPLQTGKLRPWLYTIARHACIDLIRYRTSRRRALTTSLNALEEDSVDPEESDPKKNPEIMFETGEAIKELLVSLSSLPAPYRETAYLHFLEDCSASEIAQKLDKPLTTIKSQIRRSRILLLKALQVEREREHTARSDP